MLYCWMFPSCLNSFSKKILKPYLDTKLKIRKLLKNTGSTEQIIFCPHIFKACLASREMTRLIILLKKHDWKLFGTKDCNTVDVLAAVVVLTTKTCPTTLTLYF